MGEDFLAAMFKGEDNQGQAQLLMTKEHLAVVQADMNWYNHFSNAGFARSGSSATIAEETLSPEKDEAVFRGRLDGRFNDGAVQSKFTLRLTKDKESGKWRVSFFTYADPTPVEKKP